MSTTIRLPRKRGRKETTTVAAASDATWTLSADQQEESFYRVSNPAGEAMFMLATVAGSVVVADVTDTPIDAGGFIAWNRDPDLVRVSFYNPSGASVDIVAYPYSPGDR